MKHAEKSIFFVLLLAFMLVFGMTQTALAAGTSAGTNILNQASVDYEVGTINQPDIPSSPTGCDNPACGADTDFEVDRKLDVLVDEVGPARATVVPGDLATAMTGTDCLKFDVTNESNATLDIPLSLYQTNVDDPHGGTESEQIANLANCEIRLDDGDDACETSGQDSIVAYLNDMTEDETRTVWVTCNIDNDWVDGDIAAVTLEASFAESAGTPGSAISSDDTGSADTPGAVDDVFADGLCLDTQTSPGGCETGRDANYDGKHSDTDSFEVNSADLTVTKTSVVYWDPVNGTTNPKAIPGAIITYTITVANAGDVDADNVVVTDDLTTTIALGVTFKTQYNDGVTSCAAGSGIVVSTAVSAPAPNTCETNAAADDNADFSGTTDVVTGTIGTVSSGGGSETVKFQVTID